MRVNPSITLSGFIIVNLVTQVVIHPFIRMSNKEQGARERNGPRKGLTKGLRAAVC